MIKVDCLFSYIGVGFGFEERFDSDPEFEMRFEAFPYEGVGILFGEGSL